MNQTLTRSTRLVPKHRTLVPWVPDTDRKYQTLVPEVPGTDRKYQNLVPEIPENTRNTRKHRNHQKKSWMPEKLNIASDGMASETELKIAQSSKW